MPLPVTYADVAAAARLLEGQALRTPVATSRTIDERTGARVFFKCENLQRAGAFKFRGAYNALANLTRAQQRAGVVAYSSGNHAQAVALAGRLLGVKAVIVMPADAPAVKVDATRGYGAEVALYDRERDDRERRPLLGLPAVVDQRALHDHGTGDAWMRHGETVFILNELSAGARTVSVAGAYHARRETSRQTRPRTP
mgnify:CR=1 FL=1